MDKVKLTPKRWEVLERMEAGNQLFLDEFRGRTAFF